MVQLGGTRLKYELDRVPLWRGNHVGIKMLAEDVAKYLYLPRLRDEDVLLAAIRDGVERLTWQTETFAYADNWDEQRKRYKGLQAGRSIRVLIDGQSLLVKSDEAARQLEADKAEQDKKAAPTTGTKGDFRLAGTCTPARPGMALLSESGGTCVARSGSTGTSITCWQSPTVSRLSCCRGRRWRSLWKHVRKLLCAAGNVPHGADRYHHHSYAPSRLSLI